MPAQQEVRTARRRKAQETKPKEHPDTEVESERIPKHENKRKSQKAKIKKRRRKRVTKKRNLSWCKRTDC